MMQSREENRGPVYAISCEMKGRYIVLEGVAQTLKSIALYHSPPPPSHHKQKQRNDRLWDV